MACSLNERLYSIKPGGSGQLAGERSSGGGVHCVFCPLRRPATRLRTLSHPMTPTPRRIAVAAAPPERSRVVPWRTGRGLPLLLALLPCLILPAARADEPATVFDQTMMFDAAQRDRVRARLDVSDRHYRQIEPTLAHLVATQGTHLAALDADARTSRLVDLADFIDRLREAHADDEVIGADRALVGLLDPDPGLAPKEITALADAYGAEATIFKRRSADDSISAVATRFLAAVEAAAAGSAPTTIVVLGHGLPEEIQSYSIPVDRLAAVLVAGAGARPPATGPRRLDLSHLVLVCDDCYSADFLTNLGRAIERQGAAAGLTTAALPACIAGTSYGRVGRADVAATFVPHFWKDVIELYYIRRPRPAAVTLGDFFETVDNMMYGYGRVPVVEDGRVAGYRTVDPDAVQDPVVFVSLTDDDLATLRRLLGLPADAALPRLFDIG